MSFLNSEDNNYLLGGREECLSKWYEMKGHYLDE